MAATHKLPTANKAQLKTPCVPQHMQRQVASEQAASCQQDTLHITCGTLFSWRGTYPRSDSVGLPMWATITLSAPAAAAAAGPFSLAGSARVAGMGLPGTAASRGMRSSGGDLCVIPLTAVPPPAGRQNIVRQAFGCSCGVRAPTAGASLSESRKLPITNQGSAQNM